MEDYPLLLLDHGRHGAENLRAAELTAPLADSFPSYPFGRTAAAMLAVAGCFLASAESAATDGDRPDMTEAAARSYGRLPTAIVNYTPAVSSYPEGNLTELDTVVDSGVGQKASDGSTWMRVLVKHRLRPGDDACAWIAKSDLRQVRVQEQPNICQDQAPQLKNRYTLGKDFNCAPHACEDGTYYSKANPACYKTLALNYNEATGTPYNRLRLKMLDGFHYRYTTLDGKRAWGRAVVDLPEPGSQKPEKTSIWVNINRDCVAGNLRGGTPEQT
jgi:hypothetical protein